MQSIDSIHLFNALISGQRCRMHDVDTALLRTFLALAETGSFSRTGDLIGRSQSAVSGQIRKLEQTFGRALLIRDTRNVRLTADGERLRTHARAMVASADAMLARFRTAEVAGKVRFGSPEDFASAYLPDILGVFSAAHPDVELHVSCKLTLTLMAEFAAGEQDLIIVKQDPARRHPGAQPLWRETLVWVGAEAATFDNVRASFAARGRPLPLVLSPAPCVYRQRATVALDAAHQGWTGVFVSPSHAGCAAAVKAGLGYAVMPLTMVPQGVAVMGPDWPILAEAEIAMLGASRLGPAAAALAAFVAERVTRRRVEG
jgi:DNA-binding transcriptional LysR family regulator